MFNLFFSFLVFVCSLNNVEGTTCYDELGCFDKGYPFYDFPIRPISCLPSSREEVGTQFILHTRRNSIRDEFISGNDPYSILNSNFDPSNPTKFIIHGFQDSGFDNWVTEMHRSLLTEGNYNVINVDWSKGSQVGYAQAAGNTRIVGAEIALLVEKLQSIVGISLNSIHLIGHSLGAHIAGYAGERLSGIGRITGLDAAGPYFENTEPIVRLDPTDAVFVDAIHTDTDSVFRLGFGMHEPVGHLDFYPNGGTNQPGCDESMCKNTSDKGLIDAGIYSISCNHLRVLDYFTASTDNQRQFLAFSCQDYETYINGGCFVCGADGCPRMGLHADEYRRSNQSQRVVAFLRTVAEQPYAATDVTVEVTMATKPDGGHFKERGCLYIAWNGSALITPAKTLSQTEDFVSGQTYKFSTVIPENLGEIQGINLWYEPWKWNLWIMPGIYIQAVNVTDYPVAKKITLCGSGAKIKRGEAATFQPSQSC